MSRLSEITRRVLNVLKPSPLTVLLVVLILAGCATTTTEYIYVEPDCTVPPIVEPAGFSWDELQGVPVETLEDIDETVQALIDEVLIRQRMLEEICS